MRNVQKKRIWGLRESDGGMETKKAKWERGGLRGIKEQRQEV